MTKKNIRRRKGQKQNRRTMRGRNIKSGRNTKKGVNIRSGNNRKRLRTKKNMKGGAIRRAPRQYAKFAPYRKNENSKIKGKAKARAARQAEEEIINYNDEIFARFDFDTCNCESHVWLKEQGFKKAEFRIETQTLRGLAPESRLMPHYTSKMREKMKFALDQFQDPAVAEQVFKDIVEDRIVREIDIFKLINSFLKGEDTELNSEQIKFIVNLESTTQQEFYGKTFWSDEINALIKLNQGFCPYCGHKLDVLSATGEHTHGRTLVHYLTRSLNPEENIYCVTPMCGKCNTADNPPSVVVSPEEEIKILEKHKIGNGDKRTMTQETFNLDNPRHHLIFRMCLYRDIKSYILMGRDSNYSDVLTARNNDYNQFMGTVHLTNLMTTIFNATTVRDPPEAEQLEEILKIYQRQMNQVNELSMIIKDSTLTQSINQLNELIDTLFQEGIDTGIVAETLTNWDRDEELAVKLRDIIEVEEQRNQLLSQRAASALVSLSQQSRIEGLEQKLLQSQQVLDLASGLLQQFELIPNDLEGL